MLDSPFLVDGSKAILTVGDVVTTVGYIFPFYWTWHFGFRNPILRFLHNVKGFHSKRKASHATLTVIEAHIYTHREEWVYESIGVGKYNHSFWGLIDKKRGIFVGKIHDEIVVKSFTKNLIEVRSVNGAYDWVSDIELTYLWRRRIRRLLVWHEKLRQKERQRASREAARKRLLEQEQRVEQEFFAPYKPKMLSEQIAFREYDDPWVTEIKDYLASMPVKKSRLARPTKGFK